MCGDFMCDVLCFYLIYIKVKLHQGPTRSNIGKYQHFGLDAQIRVKEIEELVGIM